jgi:hypothetical protein
VPKNVTPSQTIRIDARQNESAVAYLARCLRAAQELRVDVCVFYEGIVIVVTPQMTPEQMANDWIEAKHNQR